MITEPTTQEHIRALLAAAVRDGELSPEHGNAWSTLLHSVGTAATLAPRAQQIYPDCDAEARGYVAATWAPVATAYAELAATVCPGGEKHAT